MAALRIGRSGRTGEPFVTKEVRRTVESRARVRVCVPFHSFHRASQPSRACLGWSPLRMSITQALSASSPANSRDLSALWRANARSPATALGELEADCSRLPDSDPRPQGGRPQAPGLASGPIYDLRQTCPICPQQGKLASALPTLEPDMGTKSFSQPTAQGKMRSP